MTSTGVCPDCANGCAMERPSVDVSTSSSLASRLPCRLPSGKERSST